MPAQSRRAGSVPNSGLIHLSPLAGRGRVACQGLFSRNRRRNRVREAPFAAEPAQPSVLRPFPQPCPSPFIGEVETPPQGTTGGAPRTEGAVWGQRVTPHPDGSAVSTSPSGRGKVVRDGSRHCNH